MTENDDRKGCWNCVKAIYVSKSGMHSAIICKDQIKDDITDLKDMTHEVCDKWERKWRDTAHCPFFKASEYDVNGDRDELCLFDLTQCNCLGCHKGEGYSIERINRHIKLIDRYATIVADERRARDNKMAFDDYMEYRKSLLDREKADYRKYQQELKDLDKL